MKYTDEEICEQTRRNMPNFLDYGPYRVRYRNDYKEAFTQEKEAVILGLRTATVVAIFADPKDGEERTAMEAMNVGWLLSQRELTGKETEVELSAPYRRAVLYNYSKAANT
jgi:hypothetical protein